MKPKERLARMSRGENIDRIPFMPTLFEHAAMLIKKTPSEAAQDERLLEEAQLKAYEVYGHDSVTVGIDVYNIEAEALGCSVRYQKDFSIPGIENHPMEDEIDTGNISFSIEKGRIGKIIKAAENVHRQIGDEVNVGIGICGPFSICAELRGYENLIMDCISGEEGIVELLKAVLEFQKDYSSAIASRNLGITLFESWASPPLVSPKIFREYVMPYERELIKHIKGCGVTAMPLVIGGNTVEILDDIINTGTTLLVADYSVDMRFYVEKAAEKNLTVRGNIDPKLVERGSLEDICKSAEQAINCSGGYKKFVLGTGVIPYHTPKEHLTVIKDYLENQV